MRKKSNSKKDEVSLFSSLTVLAKIDRKLFID